jgi:hypothetical protein
MWGQFYPPFLTICTLIYHRSQPHIILLLGDVHGCSTSPALLVLAGCHVVAAKFPTRGREAGLVLRDEAVPLAPSHGRGRKQGQERGESGARALIRPFHWIGLDFSFHVFCLPVATFP